MNEPLDSKQAAAHRRAARARRIRAIRGTTAALTVSLVIAFSAAVAQRPDLGENAAARTAPSSATDTDPVFDQPERLVTSQS